MIRRQSNWFNDGRAFEDMLAKTATAYRHQRLLALEKVDPPTKVMTYFEDGQRKQRVIFMRNPFPDFVGAWWERGGRMIALEAKCTSEPQLPISKEKLKPEQIDALVRWHHAGAAVGVLWHIKGETRFLPIGRIVQTAKQRRHMKWEQADPIAQGKGFVLVDFLTHLRKWYPGQTVLPAGPPPVCAKCQGIECACLENGHLAEVFGQ